MSEKIVDLAQFKQRQAARSAIGRGQVACAACGLGVFAKVQTCPHCGVHFAGCAADYAPQPARSWRWWAVLGISLLALLAALLGR